MTTPRQPRPFPSRDPHRDDDDAHVIDAQLAHGREIVLHKHGQRYVFRWEPGREQELIDRLVGMVRDPACELDWFDAAMLSHQLGSRMGQQIHSLLKLHKAAS